MVVGAEVPDGITAKSTGRAASSTLIPGVGSGGAYEREGLIADPTCNLGRFDLIVTFRNPTWVQAEVEFVSPRLGIYSAPATTIRRPTSTRS